LKEIQTMTEANEAVHRAPEHSIRRVIELEPSSCSLIEEFVA